MGAIGLMGAMACLLVLLSFTPTPASPPEYALMRGAMEGVAVSSRRISSPERTKATWIALIVSPGRVAIHSAGTKAMAGSANGVAPASAGAMNV